MVERRLGRSLKVEVNSPAILSYLNLLMSSMIVSADIDSVLAVLM